MLTSAPPRLRASVVASQCRPSRGLRALRPRAVVHLTSTDLRAWGNPRPITVGSDRVIDTSVLRLTDGTWRLFYADERDRKSIHVDVVVSDDRAFLFYFTPPGRRGAGERKDGPEQRRSSIQVVEPGLTDGRLTADRDRPTRVRLLAPRRAPAPSAGGA